MRALRRLVAAALLSVPAFGVLGLVAAPAASAHPLGNFTVNHYDGLVLSPGHVRVTYVLDMAEIPTFQQKASIDANGDGALDPVERRSWAAREAAALMPQLSLEVDGRPAALSAACQATVALRPGQGGLPILRLVSGFDAALPASGKLAFADGTFAGRIGWKEITAAASSGVTLAGSTVPAVSASDALLRYPVDLLSNPLDVTSANASFRSTGPAGGPLPCSAQGAGTPKAATNAFAALVTWRLSPPVLLVSLLLAFLFGVVHALGPGHGKTITAAYLVGAGAKPRQAVGVGAAVALMHTASVLALGLAAAALSASFPSERIYPWLTVATGAVALTLGLVMLVLRLRARRVGEAAAHGHTHPWDAPPEHDHGATELVPGHDDVPFAGAGETGGGLATLVLVEAPQVTAVLMEDPRPRPAHEGDHDHDHHDEPGRAVSRPRLLALAVAGGILPSPTALVVLLAALSAHRVGYGLALIVAFSVGLAAALIAIGVLALRARAVVSRRLGGRVAALVPIVSALVIAGFGLFFLIRGVVQVGA